MSGGADTACVRVDSLFLIDNSYFKIIMSEKLTQMTGGADTASHPLLSKKILGESIKLTQKS